MVLGYVLLTCAVVALIVALGAVAWQRDTARMEADAWKAGLWRVDPDEARAVTFVTTPLPRRRWWRR